MAISQSVLVYFVFMFVGYWESAESPNDPKLSDGGAWRGSCVVKRRRDMQARKEERTDETRTSQK